VIPPGSWPKGRDFRFWLGTVLTAPDKLRPLYPQQQTLQPACPLSRRWRPLYPGDLTRTLAQFITAAYKLRLWKAGILGIKKSWG